jgi:hypothetical protein
MWQLQTKPPWAKKTFSMSFLLSFIYTFNVVLVMAKMKMTITTKNNNNNNNGSATAVEVSRRLPTAVRFKV